MKKLLCIITLLITTISAQVLENSVPMNLSFQGVLSSSDGTIYEDGEYDLTFRILFLSVQGNEITVWQETQSVFVANGLFSTILGSVEELPAIIPGNAELEVQVGEEVLSPRTSFTSVPFSIASNFAAISGRAQVADSSMHTVHSQYSDSSLFAVSSHNAIYADTASYVDLSNVAIPVSFSNYLDEDITLPVDWTIISQLTVNIPSTMKIHSSAFIWRVPDSGIGNSYAIQIALADANGNFIDMGTNSARFPNAASNSVQSDYVFEVGQGTYILALFAIGNGVDIARNVFLEAICIPSENSCVEENSINLNQVVFPNKMGEPLRLEK